jgi:hypothetical protein
MALSVSWLLMISLAGCDPDIFTSINNPENKYVQIGDTHSYISIPGNWKVRNDLNEMADLQYSNVRDGIYCVIITEFKDDLVNSNLTSYSSGRIDAMRSKLSSTEVTAAKELVISKRNALQYELSGILDNVKLKYLITVIEGEQKYFQILLWGSKNNYMRSEKLMEKVAASYFEKTK